MSTRRWMPNSMRVFLARRFASVSNLILYRWLHYVSWEDDPPVPYGCGLCPACRMMYQNEEIGRKYYGQP